MSIDRIGSIKDYTPNFKMIIPRFDLATWHDYIEENFRNIDALFFNLFGINNYSGSWKQITEYKQGQVLFIGDDLDINGNVTEFSGRLVKVLVDHVTDNSDYFNVFYNLHPEYYELFADASTAQIYANLSKDWANKTDGTIITPQGVDTGEYSSKKYAQEAKNSSNVTNTYKEEAKNYATNAQNSSTISQNQAKIATDSANSAKNSQTSAQNSANLAKTYADNALNDANNSKISAELSKQYANDKINQTHITNCITEIPQDIKLELNDGTLTLKAGSKVYVPNGKNADGSNKFDEVVIASDVVVDTPYTNAPIFVYYYKGSNSISQANSSAQCSGASSSITNGYWYDTTNNFVKRISNSTEHHTGESLPLGIINASNGSWASIDQVFNGFGYIGNTIFALPCVKGLIPNGRNEDGSLRNIEFTVGEVLTQTRNIFGTNKPLVIKGNDVSNYGVADYNEELNLNIGGTGTDIGRAIVGTWSTNSSGVITSFQPKLPFHAVDHNDSSWIAEQAMPSNKYVNLTLGASGSTYTAPANGWLCFGKQASATNQRIALFNAGSQSDTMIGSSIFSSSNTQGLHIFVPAKKGDKIMVTYNAAGTNIYFRFIYAEGEN